MGAGAGKGFQAVVRTIRSEDLTAVFAEVGSAQKQKLADVIAGSPFVLEEATIGSIHMAIRQRHLTFEELTQAYLDRIEAFDKPSGLNSIVLVNPDALKQARELDREFQKTGELKPLTGIPMVVKDNYNTKGLQTTAGSVALKGFEPPEDAFMVRRAVESGGIVLCKSNMGEWAFNWGHSMSSILGETRNPYDLERTTSGSSGGTGAAVAANFGVVGLGSDTGNSIRGPSAHCGLVGLRPTLGAASRTGIIPLWERNDTGGPMCRTVEDVAILFSVTAGVDPADPLTEYARDKLLPDYTKCLDRKGLQGITVGVLHIWDDDDDINDTVKLVFQAAVKDMERLGAKVVDIVNFSEEHWKLMGELWGGINEGFKHDVNLYFQSVKDHSPFADIDDIYRAGLHDPRSKMFENSSRYVEDPADPGCPDDVYTQKERCDFRDAYVRAMDTAGADVLIWPSWGSPPLRIGREFLEVDARNWMGITPGSGLPSITVPMGHVGPNKDLPAGLHITGRLFSEDTLLRVAYAYEQGTMHRKPPPLFNGFKPEKVVPLILARTMADEDARMARIDSSGKLCEQKLHSHPLKKDYNPHWSCDVCGPSCLQVGTAYCNDGGDCDWSVCTQCLCEQLLPDGDKAKESV